MLYCAFDGAGSCSRRGLGDFRAASVDAADAFAALLVRPCEEVVGRDVAAGEEYDDERYPREDADDFRRARALLFVVLVVLFVVDFRALHRFALAAAAQRADLFFLFHLAFAQRAARARTARLFFLFLALFVFLAHQSAAAHRGLVVIFFFFIAYHEVALSFFRISHCSSSNDGEAFFCNFVLYDKNGPRVSSARAGFSFRVSVRGASR